MIPRYQRILFWSLVAAILLMSAFLIRGCQAARRRLTAFNDTIPLAAPASTPTEDATLYLANDADASITPATQPLALPQDPTLRARTLLNALLATYAQPASPHPLPGGPAVDDVFLLTPPAKKPSTALARRPPTRDHLAETAPGPPAVTPAQTPAETPAQPINHPNQLAIINLHGAFVDHHPSGVVVESLTLQSILGTLHAAFPEVTQIRFLVDGQSHDTLAGHADLLRTYPALNTATKPTPLIDN